MIVYFEKPTAINQHGIISECMFVECLSINLISDKAILEFGEDDFDVISIYSIIKIQ